LAGLSLARIDSPAPSIYGTRVRRASFLVLAIVVAAGCGGGGGKRLSREEYASKADAICRKYNAQARLLVAPTNLSELAKAFDKALPLFEKAIKDLHKLKPPESEQAGADQWLARVESLKNDLAEIRDKAKDNDEQGVQATFRKATQDDQRGNQLATKLGMSACSKN
jgi:hypothetical protein